MSRVSRAVRARLVASVARDVAYLVRADRFRSLELVMEATGYLSNRGTQTSESLGAAIIALAGVLEPRWLRSTATSAAFERAFRRSNDEGIMNVRKVTGRWERANQSATRTLSLAGAAESRGS